MELERESDPDQMVNYYEQQQAEEFGYMDSTEDTNQGLIAEEQPVVPLDDETFVAQEHVLSDTTSVSPGGK